MKAGEKQNLIYETEICECGHEAPLQFIIHDNDGNGTCMPCYIEEITERLKAEKRRSRSKDLKLKSYKKLYST